MRTPVKYVQLLIIRSPKQGPPNFQEPPENAKVLIPMPRFPFRIGVSGLRLCLESLLTQNDGSLEPLQGKEAITMGYRLCR